MSTIFDICGSTRGAVLANIFPVFASGAGEVHGLWIAGPFPADIIEVVTKVVSRHLSDSGGPSGALATVETENGHHLFQSGTETRAYLTDNDGLELEREIIDDALIDLVTPGEVITFEGFHRLIDDKIFILNERTWHDGDTVRWSGSREVRQIKGGRVVLRPPAVPMLMVS